MMEGHIHIKTPKAVCDSSKGGPAKTLRCEICKPPRRSGAKKESLAAQSVLASLPTAKVALQVRLPHTMKPVDMLLHVHGSKLAVEIDGSEHVREHKRTRAISAQCGNTKLQRDVLWSSYALMCGVPVLRIPAQCADACGDAVLTHLRFGDNKCVT